MFYSGITKNEAITYKEATEMVIKSISMVPTFTENGMFWGKTWTTLNDDDDESNWIYELNNDLINDCFHSLYHLMMYLLECSFPRWNPSHNVETSL